MNEETEALAQRANEMLQARGIMLATAESCTGGLVAAAITGIAGSSRSFDRGFVTYSNDAKIAMLSVCLQTLAAHGAVSRATAVEMACGAIDASEAGAALSVTGIAGPGGGSTEKPVGLVYIGIAFRDGPHDAQEFRFGDIGRGAVRMATVKAALTLLLERL